MPSVLRLYLCAFLTDASLYLAFAALPFRALELGGGSVVLGILPTLYAVAYMTTASRAGGLSDRVPRLALARGGAAVFLLGCFALSRATGLATLLLALPALGLGLGFFWSPVQAALSDRVGGRGLARGVMGFNVAWSLGKGTGLVTGGFLTEMLDPGNALLASAVPVLLTLVLLPRDGAPRASSAATATATEPVEPTGPAGPAAPPDPAAERFLRLAWLTNAVAFGIGSTMNVHAPRLLLARDAGPGEFGVILGAVFAGQTITFALLADHRPGIRALVAAYVAGLAALAAFVVAPGFPTRVLAVLPLGACLGLAYQASIHASLDRSRGRGRAAGLHETLLGAGSSSLPLLGGWAVRATDHLAAPFVVAAAALAAGLTVTAIAGRMARSSARRAS